MVSSSLCPQSNSESEIAPVACENDNQEPQVFVCWIGYRKTGKQRQKKTSRRTFEGTGIPETMRGDALAGLRVTATSEERMKWGCIIDESSSKSICWVSGGVLDGSCHPKVPLLRLMAIGGEPSKARAAHQEIDALHASPLLLFISPSVKSPVALFVGSSSAALVLVRPHCLELLLGDVDSEQTIE
jgi:hypothetical protein